MAHTEDIENPYAEEAEARWPDLYKQSQANFKALTPEQRKQHLDFGVATTARLGQLFTDGAEPSDLRVQAEVANHYRWVSLFWTPNREAYEGLGDMYVADERFTEYYDKHAVGLAPFMRDAMRLYAASHLGGK